MRKKISMSLFLVVMLVMSIFTGCSKNSAQKSNTSSEQAKVTKGKEVKIGVINFDYSGAAGTKLKEYLQSIEKDEALNVKFIFSVAQANDQEYLAAVDALLNQGVNGILSGFDLASDAVVKACTDASVYYANFNTASIPDDFAKLKASKYYLGQVADGTVDSSSVGEAAAAIVMANGYKHVGVTSFPQKMLLGQGQTDSAFRKKMKELDPNGTVEIYPTHEHFFDGVGIDTYINSHAQMDADFAIGAGLQFDLPKIVSANKKGKIKLLAIGMLTDNTTIEEFKNGNIVMGTIAPVEAVAAPLALMIDAVNGKSYSDFKGAEQMNTSKMIIKNSEDVDNLMKYTYFADGQAPLITAEGLRNLTVTFNDKATYADLKAKLIKLDLKDAVAQNKK